MGATDFTRVTVIGLGTIGHSVAQVFATAGCEVQCFDPEASVRDGLKHRVRANLMEMISAGLVAEENLAAILDRLRVCSTEADALTDTQFVSEAAVEDLELKQQLFARIEECVANDTILASNTSTHPMTRIAEGMRHPGRALVTHPFNPPHIIPVVEVVPGEKTTLETVDMTVALLKRIGKQPVRLNKELPGFLVNRIQMAMIREVWDLLDQGLASAEDIDLAVRGSLGFRLAAVGPLRVCDFAGIDLWARVFQNLSNQITDTTTLSARVRERVDNGHYGVKTGQGFFDYSEPGVLNQQIAARDSAFLEIFKRFHQSQ